MGNSVQCLDGMSQMALLYFHCMLIKQIIHYNLHPFEVFNRKIVVSPARKSEGRPRHMSRDCGESSSHERRGGHRHHASRLRSLSSGSQSFSPASFLPSFRLKEADAGRTEDSPSATLLMRGPREDAAAPNMFPGRGRQLGVSHFSYLNHFSS